MDVGAQRLERFYRHAGRPQLVRERPPRLKHNHFHLALGIVTRASDRMQSGIPIRTSIVYFYQLTGVLASRVNLSPLGGEASAQEYDLPYRQVVRCRVD